jgi:hypothetical protein
MMQIDEHLASVSSEGNTRNLPAFCKLDKEMGVVLSLYCDAPNELQTKSRNKILLNKICLSLNWINLLYSEE